MGRSIQQMNNFCDMKRPITAAWIPCVARETRANCEPLKQTGRSLSTVLWTKVKAISLSTIHFREFIPLTGFDPLHHSLPLLLRIGEDLRVCVCCVHRLSLRPAPVAPRDLSEMRRPWSWARTEKHRIDASGAQKTRVCFCVKFSCQRPQRNLSLRLFTSNRAVYLTPDDLDA